LPRPSNEHMQSPSKALIDDIAVLYNSYCHNEAAGGLQRYLDTLSAWNRKWNMKINPSKSINQCFTLKRLLINTPELQLEGATLEQPQQAKYLGITLDKRL
ncbi:hypothetical protein KR038_010107, partial [Drosophila bunnanda]